MRDVRMKGFAERADVEDVERFLAEHTRALDREAVPIDACAGRVLARDVAAEVGVAAPPCVRRPRVRLVITGDELLPPGSRPTGARIVDSNSVMLAALAARD